MTGDRPRGEFVVFEFIHRPLLLAYRCRVITAVLRKLVVSLQDKLFSIYKSLCRTDYDSFSSFLFKN